uniref:Chaperone DnaJ C-terminal domain-containing protein n=1 Tax=Aegilops tauschii subsp. strangulata TaxID=200361 RepID=A0A452ZW93_AEGTS
MLLTWTVVSNSSASFGLLACSVLLSYLVLVLGAWFQRKKEVILSANIDTKACSSLTVCRKTIPVEEILTIDVKPGWKKGTKITFPEKGNEQPHTIAADLVFIIDEKPHPVYTRDGNDLVATQKIPLAEALTGYTVHLTTLDGRSLTVPISSVIHPGYEEVVRGEGMPIPKDPSRKGNLRVKFDIKFPARLTADQKSGVKRLLGQ